MNAYLVTYDLSAPGQKYRCIKQIIESNYMWLHFMESNFIIKTHQSPDQIRDNLSRCLDENDSLIVIELSRDWASYGISQEAINWLYQNL